MERIKRAERFHQQPKRIKRPKVLDHCLGIYDSERSKIPEELRVSFSDGTTAVYQLKVEMPAPILY